MTAGEPFCTRLQRIMDDRGMTQAELARRLDVSRTCVHQWYWGVNQPSIEGLRALRRILRCGWDELMG